MKLFVPGRICLFGEHSDWAGGHRNINRDIGKGHTVIIGTNQGLYANITPHPNKLILQSSLGKDAGVNTCQLPMERSALLREAESGNFFSYAAGVAYHAVIKHPVGGLNICNYLTDLPIKKGLSSSAALCVLVARAFNKIYDLKMTVREEMEVAYLGETTTPSKCGRMDQGCAYGNRPIMMTFDSDQVDVQELLISQNLFFVIVDLGASKDTREILTKLNDCYPFARNKSHENVHKYLGPTNARITHEARDALIQGDSARIGQLMKEAQARFDETMQPICPSQLTAPNLHRMLDYEPIQPYTFGGKGVGSQGDGSAQFIAKDKVSQQKIIDILQSELKMSCLKLTLKYKPENSA